MSIRRYGRAPGSGRSPRSRPRPSDGEGEAGGDTLSGLATTTTVVEGVAPPNYSLSYDAEDMPTAMIGPGNSDGSRLDEVCTGTDDDCAEELNAFGLVRADLLVDFLDRRGILDEIDAVYSSHKYRTYQTVLPRS